ncbi:MAG: AmmeMemoRadiSam system protein B [Treponema sp.]|nr:AmmeMemoRadiSam system protein B [Treponema sp.]
MEAVFAQKKRVRSPVGAGVFYPEDKRGILKFIRSFGLEAGKGGNAQAIIAPHGAWDFSGALAANAFSSAMGRSSNINRVVILGPIHDKREKGLFLSNSHSFNTPLGNILVDRDISEELKFNGNYFVIDDIPHLGEHSIEILLPFVKYCFPQASIVPILMGQPSEEYIDDLAHALKAVIAPVLDETLIVVSCNLSCDNDTATARLLAEECLRLFSEKDAPAIASAILDGSINACGGALVVSLLESGLLDGKDSCSPANYMVSAVGSTVDNTENNTVFYSAVSFE